MFQVLWLFACQELQGKEDALLCGGQTGWWAIGS